MRATLRYPDFCEGWNALVRLGLTDDKKKRPTDKVPYFNWAAQNIPVNESLSHEENIAGFPGVSSKSKVIRQLKFLGILNGDLINLGNKPMRAFYSTFSKPA